MQKVIGLCRENGWVVRKDVEAALGVSQATAILLLRETVSYTHLTLPTKLEV